MNRAQGRIDYLAAAKAAGIVLVTIGHAEPVSTTFPKLWSVIYSFHMPLFFFISGFFSKPAGALTAAGYAGLARRQAAKLMVPYVVVSLAFAAIKALAPGAVKRPIVVSQLPYDIFVFPSGNPALFLWFIYTLFVIRLVWPLACRLPALLLIAILIPFQIWRIDIPIFLAGYVMYFLAFYFLGAVAARHFDALAGELARPLWLAVALLVFAAINAFDASMLPAPMRFVVAIAGIWMTLALCYMGRGGARHAFVSTLDRHSFDIYLFQYFFIFPTYFVLKKAGIPPELIVPVNVVVGLLGPIVLIRLARRRAPALLRLLTGSGSNPAR